MDLGNSEHDAMAQHKSMQLGVACDQVTNAAVHLVTNTDQVMLQMWLMAFGQCCKLYSY